MIRYPSVNHLVGNKPTLKLANQSFILSRTSRGNLQFAPNTLTWVKWISIPHTKPWFTYTYHDDLLLMAAERYWSIYLQTLNSVFQLYQEWKTSQIWYLSFQNLLRQRLSSNSHALSGFHVWQNSHRFPTFQAIQWQWPHVLICHSEISGVLTWPSMPFSGSQSRQCDLPPRALILSSGQLTSILRPRLIQSYTWFGSTI